MEYIMTDFVLVSKGEDNRPYLEVEIYGIPIIGLLDSGAMRSIVGSSGWKMLQPYCKLIDPKFKCITVANGDRVPIVGAIEVPVKVKDKVHIFNFLVIPQLSHTLILGTDFWDKFGIRPDMSNRVWDFSPSVCSSETMDNLTEGQKIALGKLVEQAFHQQSGGIGCTALVEHTIETDSPPIKQRYYPVSPIVQENINKAVDELLAEGIIEPSASAWSSPILIVKKKDGSYRFVVDFRKLNRVTKRDSYPIPYISSILDKLRNAKYLTSLDIRSAYFQVPLEENSKPFTAFTIPGKGLFQFKRLPMGLSNSPATFQRLMDRVLGPELEPYVFVYLDDVIIVTDTFEKHMHVLNDVLSRLTTAGLVLNKEKCEFCRSELRYLGYVVDRQGLHVDPAKVQSMVEYPRPNSVTAVRRFCGMVSWYRKFIPNFSDLLSPITSLLKKKKRFNWTEDCESAFVLLKEKLIQAPILTCPDFSKSFLVHTDASGYGIGVVLTQKDENDEEKVICYLSRTLSRTEKNYTPTERECLAVLWAIEKLRPYLEGSKFTVITDHYSLLWLNNLRDPQGRLARWAVRLQQFQFEIIHRKGKEHLVPDALSRAVPEVNVVESTLIKDNWYRKQIKAVQALPEKFPGWRIDGGNLYRHVTQNSFEREDGRWKLVIPREKRRDILLECHDEILGGHGGVRSTYDRITKQYFWPKMRQDIANYVKSCHICQTTKPQLQKKAGLMVSRTNVKSPWELLSTDLIGPLPRSNRGYKYILTVVDYFSKFPLFFPLRSATAQNVTRIIEDEVFMVFGVPKWIVCDNGVQFKSKEFSALTSKYGVTINYTAYYHPQANPSERFNQTVKTKLRAYIADNHRMWDVLLPKVACAIRTSSHEVLKTTPYFVLFGRDMPLKQNSESIPEEGFQIDRDSTDCHWFKTLGTVINDVRKKIIHSADKSKERYNMRHRDTQYFPHDLVLRKNHVLSDAAKYYTAKLAPTFIGPYQITRKVSPWTYELRTLDGNSVGIWHAKDLKIYNERSSRIN